MKTKLARLVIMVSALCAAALLADPAPVTIAPPAQQPVRVSVQLTPEQTAALLAALAPSFVLPEGVSAAQIQSISAHRADAETGASLDLVFDLTWPAPEEEE